MNVRKTYKYSVTDLELEPKHRRSCKKCVYYARDGWCKSFRITCSATSNARICSRYTTKKMQELRKEFKKTKYQKKTK